MWFLRFFNLLTAMYCSFLCGKYFVSENFVVFFKIST